MRIMLDTNIYGILVADRDRSLILEKLAASEKVKVCGNSVIRKELRGVPSDGTGKSIRNDLLTIFDQLVQHRNYDITAGIAKIADDYYYVYRKVGGNAGRDEMMNDFLIVACASHHDLDVVVSEDRRTMASDTALKAYQIVNALIKKRVPNFIRYEKMKAMVSK